MVLYRGRSLIHESRGGTRVIFTSQRRSPAFGLRAGRLLASETPAARRIIRRVAAKGTSRRVGVHEANRRFTARSAPVSSLGRFSYFSRDELLHPSAAARGDE